KNRISPPMCTDPAGSLTPSSERLMVGLVIWRASGAAPRIEKNSAAQRIERRSNRMWRTSNPILFPGGVGRQHVTQIASGVRFRHTRDVLRRSRDHHLASAAAAFRP